MIHDDSSGEPIQSTNEGVREAVTANDNPPGIPALLGQAPPYVRVVAVISREMNPSGRGAEPDP
jgi:hypothetical protein